MPILDQGMQSPVRNVGANNPKQLAFRGTTAANGDMTLAAGSDYEGAFTAPTRNTNTYTITSGPFKSLLSCMFETGTHIQLNSVTADGAAGTVVLVFNATLNATVFNALLTFDRGSE